MNGRERILTALSIQEADRVPLFIHGTNERPIMGIGRHLTDGLPTGKTIDEMTDAEKAKVIDTLFLILEEVEAAVRQVIEDVAAGGGLIIDSSNTYHPEVKPENVMAVFTATHKYGVYPPRPGQRG